LGFRISGRHGDKLTISGPAPPRRREAFNTEAVPGLVGLRSCPTLSIAPVYSRNLTTRAGAIPLVPLASLELLCHRHESENSVGSTTMKPVNTTMGWNRRDFLKTAGASVAGIISGGVRPQRPGKHPAGESSA
jgi:hypothetical protein